MLMQNASGYTRNEVTRNFAFCIFNSALIFEALLQKLFVVKSNNTGKCLAFEEFE